MRMTASRAVPGPGKGSAGRTARRSQARFALALAAGKAAGTASRVLGVGGGTSFPGAAARWIDPHVLQKAAAASNASKADRHGEQRQDDDLPDARCPRAGRRPQGHPEPVRAPTCCKE